MDPGKERAQFFFKLNYIQIIRSMYTLTELNTETSQ